VIEFRACYPEHVRLVQVQPEQQAGRDYVIGHGYEESVINGLSFSAWKNARCVAAGGLFTQWGQHGNAWLMASAEIGPDMTRLTRFTKELFVFSPYKRITITVDCEFEAAHRWATMLGFEMECERMKAYSPTGRDAALYAWIRKPADG